MSNELILYDLPSKGRCRSWSANTLKTRIALNYKKIPYKTQWVPFPEVKETIKATGVPPNPPSAFSEFSVPVVRFPDGSYIMDSAKIAPFLEKLQPTPSLRLNPDIEGELGAAFGEAFGPLRYCIAMPEIARSIIREEDREWFYADRERRFGAPLDELERREGGEEAWEKARVGFEKIRGVMGRWKKDDGPFILGSEPCYADFMLIAGVHMFSLFPGEKFERFLGMCEPELRELYQAGKVWVERDD